MSIPERTKIQIWEGPENPVPVPQEMELLDKETSSLPSLFSRVGVEGAKGIDIYQAAYDGRSGYTLFGWRDDKGKTKGQLLHDDKTTSSGLSSSSWRNWRNGMTICARRRDDPGGAGRWHSTTSPS